PPRCPNADRGLIAAPFAFQADNSDDVGPNAPGNGQRAARIMRIIATSLPFLQARDPSLLGLRPSHTRTSHAAKKAKTVLSPYPLVIRDRSVGVPIDSFAAQYLALPMLRLRPRDRKRTARGRCGSLLLHRQWTGAAYLPAHCNNANNRGFHRCTRPSRDGARIET